MPVNREDVGSSAFVAGHRRRQAKSRGASGGGLAERVVDVLKPGIAPAEPGHPGADVEQDLLEVAAPQPELAVPEVGVAGHEVLVAGGDRRDAAVLDERSATVYVVTDTEDLHRFAVLSAAALWGGPRRRLDADRLPPHAASSAQEASPPDVPRGHPATAGASPEAAPSSSAAYSGAKKKCSRAAPEDASEVAPSRRMSPPMRTATMSCTGSTNVNSCCAPTAA